MDETPIDFVTIMTPEGIRLTHRDRAEIGRPYLGADAPALRGEPLTEEAIGTLGPSLRSVVPVTSDGEIVALVSAGITLGSVGSGVWGQVPFVVAVAMALAAIGLVAAWIAGRFTRRIAGDLPAGTVRDAVSSVRVGPHAGRSAACPDARAREPDAHGRGSAGTRPHPGGRSAS